MKIAFVTEELSNVGRSGGIGAAIFELAISLAKRGHEIDIHLCATDPLIEIKNAQDVFRGFSVNLVPVNAEKYVHNIWPAECRSYAVYKHLSDFPVKYDFIHFHDYKGLGFFTCTAKRQGLNFTASTLVVQLHGPTRWAVHANRALFFHSDQLVVDHLEKETIRLADHIVSPSVYLVDWLVQNGFVLPPEDRVHVIKNAYEHCERIARRSRADTVGKIDINEIVFFGRHEARKGIITFCNALDIIGDDLAARGTKVVFAGGLGDINGRPSGIYLTERAKRWKFTFSFRVNFDRIEAISFLKSRTSSLVVIPSSAENSPYTVVETIAAGCPVLTSFDGGAKELIDPAQHAETVVNSQDQDLADKLIQIVRNGAPIPRFSEAPEAVALAWDNFHGQNYEPVIDEMKKEEQWPKVTVGITHFNRPQKLLAAVMSVLRQTYQNIELVVVDDGSNSAEALMALPHIRTLLDRVGGRLIVRENGYLGAARNSVLRSTESDYLLFLDDDDMLFPEAVQKLVDVALRTAADITNCLNVFMDVSVRGSYELVPEGHDTKVSYVPCGGPLSVSHQRNPFGAATALIKRGLFNQVGGYTELKGVGYEDYEFYVRAAQIGANIQIVPMPLYLYEVGRPSMINSTSFMANKLRVMEAIDYKLNRDAWRDATEVAAGSETIANQTNSWNWITNSSPHKHHLERISNSTASLAEHVAALASYAIAVDAPAAAAAWEKSLLSSVNKRNFYEEPVSSIENIDVHANSFDSERLRNRADLIGLFKLRRFDTLVDAIRDQVAASNSIDGDTSDFLYMLAGTYKLRADTTSRLISALANVNVPARRIAEIRGVVLLLAINARLETVAKRQLQLLLLAESKDYIAANPDLAEGYKERALQVALEHFDDHGRMEGRLGFPVMERVSRALRPLIQRPIGLRDMIESFEEMFVDDLVSAIS